MSYTRRNQDITYYPIGNQPRYTDDDYQYLVERYGPDLDYEIITNNINRYQRSPRRR